MHGGKLSDETAGAGHWGRHRGTASSTVKEVREKEGWELTLVRVGACSQQRGHHLRVPVSRRHDERGVAVGVG